MVRLEVVRDCLPLALHEADRDPEHVHQLRVATRRARAALDIFACCLLRKIYSGARKQLRRIRRVAGEARDWDVFLANLTEWSHTHGRKPPAGLDCLVGYVVAKRESAQVELEQAGTDYPFGFDRFLAETVAAIHKPEDPSLRTPLDLARPLLSDLHQKLDDAADQDLEDYTHLHQVRILGKRLRYAMEVFADCFAPAFREQLYPVMEEMQEVLGRANDSYVACGWLELVSQRLRALAPSEWRRYRPGLESLRHYHQARQPQERQRFQDWWERWRHSGGEAALIAFLKCPTSGATPVVPRLPIPSTPGESPAA